MPFTYRGRKSFGPVRVNWGTKGITSYTITVFPGVSWNSRTRAWSFDLPGKVNYRTKGKRGGRR